MPLKLTFEIRLFFSALMFFTRIPCSAWVGHSEELLNHSARYFPLLGLKHKSEKGSMTPIYFAAGKKAAGKNISVQAGAGLSNRNVRPRSAGTTCCVAN